MPVSAGALVLYARFIWCVATAQGKLYNGLRARVVLGKPVHKHARWGKKAHLSKHSRRNLETINVNVYASAFEIKIQRKE